MGMALRVCIYNVMYVVCTVMESEIPYERLCWWSDKPTILRYYYFS